MTAPPSLPEQLTRMKAALRTVRSATDRLEAATLAAEAEVRVMRDLIDRLDSVLDEE
jgi:hypothetical protein